MISGDGSGSEFYREDQLDYYFRVKKGDPSVEELESFLVVDGNPTSLRSFFTLQKTYSDREEGRSQIKDVQIPTNLKEYKQVMRSSQAPDNPVYEYRTIIHHKPYDFFKRTAYHEDRKRYDEWEQ